MTKAVVFGALAALVFAAPAPAQVWKIGNWDATPPSAEAEPPSAAAASALEPAPAAVLDPAAAAALEPAPLASGDTHGPEAGEFEFTLGGSGSNDSDFDNGSFGFNAGLGFFLLDSLEIAARQTITYSDFGESSWIGFTRLAADLHFEIGLLAPFIGVNVGYVYGDNVNETMEAAPEAGLKIYVLEKTFIYVLGEYQFFFEDSDDADDAFDDGQFVYTLGIGFNFL